MKLILANNQSQKFVDFYAELKAQSDTPFDYSSYAALLFCFDTTADAPVEVFNLATNQPLTAYDGIYINGYLNTIELAITTAICADALGIAYVNQELHNAPSFSKLSSYAKLAAARVSMPRTIAGTKAVLAQAASFSDRLNFPAILKRADADRGIDNFKVTSFDQATQLLQDHEDNSLWVLQEYIDNDGFYLVSFYDSQPAFCIFRSLEQRPDNNELKAHMYKPKGGTNAHLIAVSDVPQNIVETCTQALNVMNRQIGSVDCLYDKATQTTYVLEVNYNPQLVTIETFKDSRVKAFLDNLKNIKKH